MKHYKNVEAHIKTQKCLSKVTCDCCGDEASIVHGSVVLWESAPDFIRGSGRIQSYWSCGPESDTNDTTDLCYNCAEWLMEQIKNKTLRRTFK